MPRLSLPKLVVAFLTREARTTSLDLLARVSVLEGIASVNPGAWMRNVVPEEKYSVSKTVAGPPSIAGSMGLSRARSRVIWREVEPDRWR